MTTPPLLPDAAPAAFACAVCGQAVAPGGVHCGRAVAGPLVAGPVTEGARAAAAGRLADDRRRFTVGAALRTAAACPPGGTPEWLAGLLADATPEDRAVADAARLPPSDGDPAALLAALAAGRLDRVLVVVLGPEGLTGAALTADRHGAPHAAPLPRAEWAALLPGLAGDPARGWFRLAGGDARAGAPAPLPSPAAPPGWCAPAEGPREAVVLVDRCAGWPGAAPVLAALADRCRPAATVHTTPSAAPNAEEIEAMLRTTPLRYPYALAVARREPVTGGYAVSPVDLFPAGTRPAQDRAEVRVHTPAAPDGTESVRLTVAVVAVTGDRAEEWRPVAAVEADLPAEQAVTVTVTLHAADDVRITADGAELTAPSAGGWRELLDRLAVARRELPLDVVLLLELGGPDSDRRVAAADRIVARVAAGRAPGTLRIRTVPYWEHRRRVGRAPAEPTHTVGDFKGPQQSREELEELLLHDAPVQNPFAAALEEPLSALAGLGGWAGGDRSLLVVATRPPHRGPRDRVAGASAPCPGGADWHAGAEATSGPHWTGRTVLLVPSERPASDYESRRAAKATAELWAEAAEEGWEVIGGPEEGSGAGPGPRYGSGPGYSSGSGYGSGSSPGYGSGSDDGDGEDVRRAADAVAPPVGARRPVPLPLLESA